MCVCGGCVFCGVWRVMCVEYCVCEVCVCVYGAVWCGVCVVWSV